MWRIRAGVTAIAVVVLCMLSVTAGGAVGTTHANSSAPKRGGSVIEGGFTATTMDPFAPGFNTGFQAIAGSILGQFFDPPVALQRASDSTGVVPDLATGYTFGPKLMSLTLTLRKGVKFSDGTPFNAAAAAFTFDTQRASISAASQYFTGTVTSVTTSGNYHVTLHFSHPDALMPYVLSATPAALPVDPTAFQAHGENAYGLDPIGAGPFTVSNFNPGVELVTQRYPAYWNAKHVYLDQVEYLNNSTDVSVSYSDLSSGSIQAFEMPGSVVSPQVMNPAKTNPSVTVFQGPNESYLLLNIDTYVAPFNNQMAREAIDYCTDRESIAQAIYGGYDVPAYVAAGPGEFYYPLNGYSGKDAWKGGEKLNPYLYNPAKASQIVNGLPGGLSFTFLTPSSGLDPIVSEALAQEWASCGIKAQLDILPAATVTQDTSQGAFQMAIGGGGGSLNPALFVTQFVPTSALDSHGFNIPTVTNLIDATDYTTNATALTTIWRRVYSLMDQAAVAIPIVSGSPTYLYSRCLKGTYGFFAVVVMNNAWLGCTP